MVWVRVWREREREVKNPFFCDGKCIYSLQISLGELVSLNKLSPLCELHMACLSH